MFVDLTVKITPKMRVDAQGTDNTEVSLPLLIFKYLIRFIVNLI